GWIDLHARKECETYVLKKQRQLDKAVRDKNVDRIRFITYLLSRCSRAVRIVAIERVTRTNSGKHTAGVDGVATPKSREDADKFRSNLLGMVKSNKMPSPIRRVYIPKPNGKKRPLGIPTIMDRVIQEIHRITIEPISEYHFKDCSFGFRPKKSCHDAIARIFNKISRRKDPQWILEGDIKGCFDHINHDAIIVMMKEWKMAKPIRDTIKRMLKSGIISDKGYSDSIEGTPQGGILSPMLANIALTTLDEWGETHKDKWGKRTNPIVRYADDFIVVCKTKEEALKRKGEIKSRLQKEIGLELSNEKTSITNIHEGFNFLGFNVRKYTRKSPHDKYHTNGKLLIKPQKEKVQAFLDKCGNTIREAQGNNLESLIRQLNPKLKGFTNFYRFVVSKRTFTNMTKITENGVFRMLRKSHPNKSKKWVWRRYSTDQSVTHKTKTFFMKKERLYLPMFMPIKRFVPVKMSMRVYDGSEETKVYWKNRVITNALNSIYSIRVEKLYKRQMGHCPICRKMMTGEQVRNNDLHQHHLNPQSKVKDHKLTNLRLIHSDCHTELHRILSIEEMSKLAVAKVDYCHKDYLYETNGSSNYVFDLESRVR
ncbi:MAG: group II intron reverse transcriptase/maturase, partial [Candidatus Poribacteria bacterium]